MFADIKKITLPTQVLEDTLAFMQKHGNHCNEAFALWVGEHSSSTFEISNGWFPKQSNEEICYFVDGNELFHINMKMNELKQTAIAQIHTHPKTAFHSSIDNEFAILSLIGSFSIVLPDYGFIEPGELRRWAVYRWNGMYWDYVSETEVMRTFQII